VGTECRGGQTRKKVDSKLSFLTTPYDSWTPEKILVYFQNRSNIRYFPVIDKEETKRDKVKNILKNQFEFNHELYPLPNHFDWTANPSPDVEWLILLHKFYYSVGLGIAYQETKDTHYVEKWVDLTSSWIDNVPLGFLSSDVAGRRIQNWIFSHYYFITLNPALSIPEDFYIKFLQSLYDQVSRLVDHLTPARNHRTLELYAIFLTAVVFPELKNAAQWLEFSKKELVKNIQKDILSDGVHCELSTDYHHLVLKNYLNIRKLAFLNKVPIPKEMDNQIKKALDFSLYVHKPDGLIPSLSDGDVRSFYDLLKQGYDLYGSEEILYVVTSGREGRPPSFRSKAFRKSGYYILRSGWGEGTEPYEEERYLVFDCGPLGEGNHGHLDVLSFEMAAYGQSLIVDPGRYTYDESGETNWRVRFRGTGYHNTVLVDNKNQTQYAFHKRKFKILGPEPDFELKAFISCPDFDYLHGVARSHEYEVVHERKIFFACREYWIISDLLSAREVHDYDLLFHLSDQAFGKVSKMVEQNTLLVSAPHLLMAQPFDPQLSHFVEEGYLSRTYGKKHQAPVVRFARRAADTAYHTVLYPYNKEKERPEVFVEAMPVFCGTTVCSVSQAFALSIMLIQNGQHYQDYYFSASSEFSEKYTFGDFKYNGTFLFVRKDTDGNIVRFQHDPETRVLTYEDLLT